jgi:hypothetical protein
MSVIIKLLSKFDDSGLRKAKSGFSGLTKSIGTIAFGVGVKQLADGLMESITLASDLSEQTAAVGQIFGAGSTAIENFASTANTKLGQTKTQVIAAAKTFGIFGKAAGMTEKENAKFSTSLVSLATDLASFNNTSVDEAINALGSGLRGEAEPLRRYGVLLNDATLKDEALRLGLIKTTKQALTPQQKILAANSAIYKQTITQQGDFARTSGGLANQQRILTASFEDAKTTLGASLLPMFTEFVTYLNANVIPVVQQFVKDISDPKTEAGKMFIDIKNAVEESFTAVKDFFALFGNGDAMKGFSSIATSLVKALPALLALKGIMILASAGKAIQSLVTAMTIIQGKSGIDGVVAGGSKGKGKLPVLGTGALLGLGMVLSLSGDTKTQTPEEIAQRKKEMAKNQADLFKNAGTYPGLPQRSTTTNNITINATNADPKAVVDALGKYVKQNGSLPFNLATAGRSGR